MPFTPVIFPDAFADYPQTEARIPYLENQLAPYTSAVTGVKGIPLAAGPGNNTWISGIILSCFILVALTYRTASKQMAQILYSIFGAGTERTAFISKNNVGVVRLKLVLLLQTFLLEGTILYLIFHERIPTIISGYEVLPVIGTFAAGCICYYLLQFSIYKLIGYVFAYKSYTSSWTYSFTSITAIRGLLLFCPVLIAIYHPMPLKTFIIIICCVYFITRIIFIYKGLKIFFNGFYSLIYLILYLCTLEIAPLFVIYKGLFQVFSFVELKLV